MSAELEDMAAREEYQQVKEKPQTSHPIHGWDDQEESAGCGSSLCTVVLIVVSVFLVLIFFPFSLIMLIKVVPEYERAVIFRLGRLMDREAKGPGTFFILPCIDRYQTVDLRTKSFDVPPQNILTKDSVTILVDAVVYYKIFDPVISITNIRDAGWGTRLLAQTLLRNVLGSHSLGDAMTNRDLLANQLQQSLDEATDPWGVKVERVEIKDVRLPQNLQRAMAAEAEATREAKAKVIAATGEMSAARALKEAAEVIANSPTALQLRYLQTLNVIAAEKGSTILFPIPMDMLGGMSAWGAGLGGGGQGLEQPSVI
ncbi:PREDICTED: band 7 protein AGAP004871-like isoform X2 [Amphimedon queenslandica]|uniref:Band 7 domain-containing protein n=1 Tax=Amphimedon queenslandica TaxID=400682 RepID=A0AAN0J7C7_AMPQE|nr:PREDICTED: band 7 protein AGAP004871-like isoform X2 [Amphimedon queenslandica]|eukprot:XP_019852929.1 PREDICTED: band 7 protein AGAP004871-like isoform X2 [Amphimedon queenslandica]